MRSQRYQEAKALLPPNLIHEYESLLYRYEQESYALTKLFETFYLPLQLDTPLVIDHPHEIERTFDIIFEFAKRANEIVIEAANKDLLSLETDTNEYY